MDKFCTLHTLILRFGYDEFVSSIIWRNSDLNESVALVWLTIRIKSCCHRSEQKPDFCKDSKQWFPRRSVFRVHGT